MAKIDRLTGAVAAFASGEATNERTVFGDTAQSDTLDANVTADYLRGWGIVGPSDKPTMQDFNAMAFTISQFVAYLHQAGVAEWDSAQDYHTGGVTNRAGHIYRSLVDSNTGNDPATDGGTNWSQITSDGAAAIRGAYRNLAITNTGGSATTSLTVTADELVVQNAAGGSVRLTTVNEAAAITASGAGGLDTGTEANSTWYYLWVIYNPTTAAVDAVLSTSYTLPTLPSGYTHYARVGGVYNSAAGDFITVQQVDHVVVSSISNVLNGANTPNAWTAVTVSAAVPPIAKRLSAHMSGTGNGIVGLAPRSDGLGAHVHIGNDATNTSTMGGILGASAYGASTFTIPYFGGSIYYWTNDSGSDTYIDVSGWEW